MNSIFRSTLSSFLVYLLVLMSLKPAYAQVNNAEFVENFSDVADIIGLPEAGASSRELNPGLKTQGITYKVHVVGNVSNPGSYSVSSTDRLFTLLKSSSNLPYSMGSLRKIEIRRNGVVKRTVDLLRYTLDGDLKQNPYLNRGDVIYVPLKGPLVRVMGSVKKPGVYELLNDELNLRSLLSLAGGANTHTSKGDPIQVIRYVNGEKKILKTSSMNSVDLGHFKLLAGDIVFVPHFLVKDKAFDYNFLSIPGNEKPEYPSFRKSIHVLGGVKAPQLYPYNPFFDVDDYIRDAGGFTRHAKKNKVTVLQFDGNKLPAGKVASLNPGDTIIIPEKYLSPENWLVLILGISSSILGITSAIVSINAQ